MKTLLIIIACLLTLSACNQQGRTGSSIKNDTIVKENYIDIKLNVTNDSVMGIVPEEFSTFDQPRAFIKYKQKINGYSVKVMWMQYGEVGNALFCFKKGGQIGYIFTHKWGDPILYDKYSEDEITYSDKSVIELDYTPKLSDEKYLSKRSPFFFSDVDFDGEDELVINLYMNGSRGANAYKVYECSPYGHFELKTEAPFTELENGHCEFDSTNKTITVSGSAGAYDCVEYTYQAVDNDYMDWNKPKKGKHFELVQSYVIDNGEYRIYQRRGKALELAEKGKYKPKKE